MPNFCIIDIIYVILIIVLKSKHCWDNLGIWLHFYSIDVYICSIYTVLKKSFSSDNKNYILLYKIIKGEDIEIAVYKSSWNMGLTIWVTNSPYLAVIWPKSKYRDSVKKLWFQFGYCSIWWFISYKVWGIIKPRMMLKISNQLIIK